ncbi:hypothetical protein [Pseudoxanthomonas indica]|uniref:Etoposide-induced protein 2.4 (EI24) n=1 Tax=Pseudoxanthomonas indica TaxID=428993 RepID=A0A1T5KSB0_9GAMM|nr:hypothetical protein [Pseudoxanthomonas indica]GGD51182.1 hypothetical protein GCM10007235_24230 [Pseudoxanthomonas indica]SKC66530.1 hypothetical protein SAMN06296058_1969 [Pseudoxanthomonas indica]
MNTTRNYGFWRALGGSLVGALHWRVLLLWLVALGLIALVAAFPVWRALDGALSNTVGAAAYAQALDAFALVDLSRVLGKDASVGFGVVVSGVLSVLLMPWLTGVMLAGIRLGKAGRLATIAGEGMREYGRQLRLMIWSLLPLGIALGLGAWWMNIASSHADEAILASVAERGQRWALIAAVLVFVLAHAGIELTRARIAVRDDTRSVIRAWWRSLMLYLRRPFAVLGLYLLTCVIGFAVVLGLAWLRTRVAGVNGVGLLLAVLGAQAVVAAMAWTRLARLRALAAVVLDDAQRRAAVVVETTVVAVEEVRVVEAPVAAPVA